MTPTTHSSLGAVNKRTDPAKRPQVASTRIGHLLATVIAVSSAYLHSTPVDVQAEGPVQHRVREPESTAAHTTHSHSLASLALVRARLVWLASRCPSTIDLQPQMRSRLVSLSKPVHRRRGHSFISSAVRVVHMLSDAVTPSTFEERHVTQSMPCKTQPTLCSPAHIPRDPRATTDGKLLIGLAFLR